MTVAKKWVPPLALGTGRGADPLLVKVHATGDVSHAPSLGNIDRAELADETKLPEQCAELVAEKWVPPIPLGTGHEIDPPWEQ